SGALTRPLLILEPCCEPKCIDGKVELGFVRRRYNPGYCLGDQLSFGRAEPGAQPQRLILAITEERAADPLGVREGAAKWGRQLGGSTQRPKGGAGRDELRDFALACLFHSTNVARSVDLVCALVLAQVGTSARTRSARPDDWSLKPVRAGSSDQSSVVGVTRRRWRPL